MQIDTATSNYILTADIGGSHITAGLYNLQANLLITETLTRVEVNSKSSAGDIFAAWAGAFQQAQLNVPGSCIVGASVAMPGPFDYKNGISYIQGFNKYEELYGLNIKKHMAGLLGLDPEKVRFRNDAESTIAGEAFQGAGAGYQRVLGITLGTGFGSALMQNKVTKDINLGSIPYSETIADDYFSTRWFVRRYRDLTGITLTGGVKELAGLAANNADARNIFNEFAINVAAFLANPIEQFGPEVLIICGNIAKASHLFMPYLADVLNPLTIKLAQLGELAPLLGAITLFNDEMNIKPVSPVTQL